MCGTLLGGDSGGGRIRREEYGVNCLHAMTNSLRCGVLDRYILHKLPQNSEATAIRLFGTPLPSEVLSEGHQNYNEFNCG